MKGLIGRERELEEMERRFSNPRIRTLAIYGRRRVGKTAVIREFCKGKRHLFLIANEESMEITLQSFSGELDRLLGRESEPARDFDGFLRRLKEADTTSERTVIVIDEYPYIAKNSKGADSMLQRFIDHDLQEMNAFLIICGSSVGAMDETINGREGPLYKRFIGPMRIRPLPYDVCSEFHPGMSRDDLMRVYAIAGGYPLYHILMSGSTIRECIESSLLGPYAPLYSEAEDLVRRELSPAGSALSVISAIAAGRVIMGEISQYTGMSLKWCNEVISRLELLDMVAERVPMCGANRKEKRFVITDGLIRLYREVLAGKGEMIQGDDTGAAYDAIYEDLGTFYGEMFERICVQYIRRTRSCIAVGSWWGKVGDSDTDIDIVAEVNSGGSKGHVAVECKFRNKKVGIREYEELKYASGCMVGAHNLKLCMIAREGFTEELTELAESAGIELVDLDAMYAINRLSRVDRSDS